MKRPVKIILLAAVVGLLGWRLGAVLLGGAKCEMEIRFAELPTDDSALADWLQAQPGVRQPTVTREGKTLRVAYDLPWGQPWPEVLAACDRLGYKGMTGFTTRMRNQPLLGFDGTNHRFL